jgi:hypothetical protein
VSQFRAFQGTISAENQFQRQMTSQSRDESIMALRREGKCLESLSGEQIDPR